MTPAQLVKALQARFPDYGIAPDPANPSGVVAPAGPILEILGWLRDDAETAMNYFDFVTCSDRLPGHIDVIYSLYSLTKNHRLALKVRLPRDYPTLPTASQLWQNADWNEREVYDLFGVVFQGHPDPRRLMMPDDWEGHPLRKDYLHPNLTPKPD